MLLIIKNRNVENVVRHGNCGCCSQIKNVHLQSCNTSFLLKLIISCTTNQFKGVELVGTQYKT